MTPLPPIPWFFIAAATFGMFAATASGSTRSPFLLDMASDLHASVPAIANLFGVTSVSWGLSSYFSGLGSDRFGRRVFLVMGPLGLSFAMYAASGVQSYEALALVTILAGASCGCLTTASYAEVSIRVVDAQRGRALGWVMSGQSMTLLIAVPTAAWLGASIGWRGVYAVVAVLAMVAALWLFILTFAQASIKSKSTAASGSRMTLREALSGSVVRLFVALIVERIVFGLAVFYYPAFIRTIYDAQIEDVAFPLLVFAAGNIAGTVLGGQIADRFPYRRVSFGAALLTSGLFAVPWFYWHPGLGVSITLGFCFSFFNALCRPCLMAAFAAVPDEVRGVILGLNSSVASAGWLTAAMLGGWLFTSAGFESFGPLMGVMCLLGALVVLPDSRITHRGSR